MEAVDTLLNHWANRCLNTSKFEANVSNGLSEQVDKPNVCLWLKDILPAPPKPGMRTVPLHVTLRYLVFVQSLSASESNKILEALLFSAMQDSSMDVELDLVSEQFWLALGCPPCPAFYITMHHHHKTDVVVAKPVEKPLSMRISPTARLSGTVMIQLKDKTKIPGSGAYVNLEHSNISAVTNERGQFQLGAIPPNPKKKSLAVHYKSISKHVSVSAYDVPIEILINTEEH